jgi:Clr5 domain
MDSGPADEYWLPEFVGEEENWVSKYLQDISIVGEESNCIEAPPTPGGNTTHTEASSGPASTSSSAIARGSVSVQKRPEKIPFDQKWELLKPEIERLYITKNVSLPNMIRIMKEEYRFDAV